MKKIIMTMVLVITLIAGGVTAYADTWIPAEPFDIWSEDGTSVFRWEPTERANMARAGLYRNNELVYSVFNLPTMGGSASSFFFSNDMKHFAFRPAAEQVLALGFFENGVLIQTYRIDELVRDMNVVTYTVTTASWENWNERYFDTINNTLTIVTRDDITYVFDIITGEIIYNNAGDRPFIPPAGGSWGPWSTREIPLWARPFEGEITFYRTNEIVIDDITLWRLRPDNREIHLESYILIPISPRLTDPSLSDWASNEVNHAISWGIVPEHLMSNFDQPITRAEFADFVIQLYSIFMGGVIGTDEIPPLEQELLARIDPFADTDSFSVLFATYLGLITGVGDGRFEPDSSLTREQAAVILARLVEVILENPLYPNEPILFDDATQISEWATYAVNKMQGMGIMSNARNNRFAPQATYTREQAIVTLYRIFTLWHEEMGYRFSNRPYEPSGQTDMPPPIPPPPIPLVPEQQWNITPRRSLGQMDIEIVPGGITPREAIEITTHYRIWYEATGQEILAILDITQRESISEEEGWELVFSSVDTATMSRVEFAVDGTLYSLHESGLLTVLWVGGSREYFRVADISTIADIFRIAEAYAYTEN